MATPHATIISRTDFKLHPVSGATPAALVSSIKSYLMPEGNREALKEFFVMKPRFFFKPVRTRFGCRVGDLRTHLDFTITLPQATNVNHFDQDTKRLWRRFVVHVKRHQLAQRHRTLDLAAAYERRVRLICKENCKVVKKDLKRIAREEIGRAQRRLNPFDRLARGALTRDPLFIAAEREKPAVLADFLPPNHRAP